MHSVTPWLSRFFELAVFADHAVREDHVEIRDLFLRLDELRYPEDVELIGDRWKDLSFATYCTIQRSSETSGPLDILISPLISDSIPPPLPLPLPLNLLRLRPILTQLPLLRKSHLNVPLPASSIHIPKQHIDLFEAELLGLGDEDPDERRHGEAEAAEHDEGAPFDAVDGFGRDFGDDEVEEPGGGEGGLVLGAGGCGGEGVRRGTYHCVDAARPTPYARMRVGKISDTQTREKLAQTFRCKGEGRQGCRDAARVALAS